VNILMVGLSDSVFLENAKGSNTAIRLRRYLEALQRIEPDSTLTNLIFTRRRVRSVAPCDGLWFIPVRTPRVQLFPVTGFLTALHLRHRLQPDVVTTQSPFEAGVLSLVLSWMFKAPLEVQVHFNLLSPYWLAEHRWWNWVRLSLARFVLGRADAIRVVSSPLKRSLAKTWGISDKRMAVIPVPAFYDSQPTTPTHTNLEVLSDPHSKVVLFVGRLCYPKNLPALFTVIERVLRARTDVEFLLVGDGPDRSYAVERAAALDGRRVHVMGSVPYANVPRYYRRADVLVLPSLFEGFGRVVLEGYLFNTPAVATRCGGPEDIIVGGETGFLTEIEEMEEFADRVLWLLGHPDRARRMGEQGHVHVQRMFEPERLIERMVGQWQRLAEAGANRQ